MVVESSLTFQPNIITSSNLSSSNLCLIFQGAEGKVYQSSFLGSPCIIKERFIKRYRHPLLDRQLTESRMITECRAMVRARKAGIDCPVVYFLDVSRQRLYMEHIDGMTLKNILECLTEKEIEDKFGISLQTLLEELPKRLGKAIAMLHDLGLIHGDLTSSNVMLRKTSNQNYSIVFLDFGLSMNSTMAEDKAVDLYVMERALSATHGQFKNLMNTTIEIGYFPHVNKSEAIRQKLCEEKEDEND